MYPKVVLVGHDASDVRTLDRVELAGASRNEAWLRDFLLRHPEALPASEVDRSFTKLVPVAREVSTPAGPIDALFATPQGGLVVVECKLWRNPQARREVVGQILDYAKELAQWHYEDLQREIARARRNAPSLFPDFPDAPGGDLLFASVRQRHPNAHQSTFADAVSRNLRQGRFLLLIAGDGIREGTETIARFMAEHGGMRFTLGLIEMAGYELPNGGLIVQPRVLARTVQIERTVVRIRDLGLNAALASGDEADDTETSSEEAEAGRITTRRRLDPAYLAEDRSFWDRFADALQLDDPAQPPARRAGVGNARLPLAPGAHTTVYRLRTPPRIGIFATMPADLFEQVVGTEGSQEKQQIETEIRAALDGDPEIVWGGDDRRAWVAARWPESFSPAAEADDRHIDRLTSAANVFVNVFRPRVLRALEG